MKIRQVRLHNFRNHAESAWELGSGVNVLLGKNGQGKTNLLEAISCLALTKSFYAANEATLIQLGQNAYLVEGVLVSDTGIEQEVSVSFARDQEGKTYIVDGERFERLASAIGMFPLVVLSPENSAITFGGPVHRRKFIDMVLSQLSRAYFEDLLEYRHVLRQRNRVLGEAKLHGGLRRDILEPWDEALASRGARIVQRRAQFVADVRQQILECYIGLVDSPELPEILYVASIGQPSELNTEQITEILRRQLEERFAEESQRGMSLVGPHRDDLLFQLGGIDLQKYASQGQHKTFLIALKLAEFLYLKAKKGETPMLLLDDVLSELDADRSRRLLEHILGLGQAIVTTTDDSLFNGVLQWGEEHRRSYVEQGTCRPINSNKEAAVGA
jgi:DNA replication and repair protein RecF